MGALWNLGLPSRSESELSAFSRRRKTSGVGEDLAVLSSDAGRISKTRLCGMIRWLGERRGGNVGGPGLVINMLSACLSASDFATPTYSVGGYCTRGRSLALPFLVVLGHVL
jgi:hypothetical protein